MTRFSFAALLVLSCAWHAGSAADLSDADRTTFKANFKPACMQTNTALVDVLEPGAYEAMCDCAGARILEQLRAMPQNEARPLLNPDSDEGKKKWAEMGKEASQACGAKPFAQAMTKVIAKTCMSGKLANYAAGANSLMPAQRCECFGQEFAERYTLASINAMSDQDAINRFAQQTLLVAQSACKPK